MAERSPDASGTGRVPAGRPVADRVAEPRGAMRSISVEPHPEERKPRSVGG